MKRIIKSVLFLVVSVFVVGASHADLLDTAFQPSMNMDQVVDIGNSKNAVGNEVFRGSSKLELLDKKCYEQILLTESNEENCTAAQGKWKDEICFNTTPLEYDKKTCEDKQVDGVVWIQLEDIIQPRDSLLVRVTKTLLRLTIALSIPIIIFIGSRTIRKSMNGESYTESIKEVGMVIAGLVLALSAIGIIYLIQSITVSSL